MDTSTGKRLAEARRDRGLTQKQLAEKLGIDALTVSRYERDDQPMSLARATAVCLALQIQAPWLLYGVGDRDIRNTSADRLPEAG